MNLQRICVALGVSLTYATLSSAFPSQNSSKVCQNYAVPVGVSTQFFTLTLPEFTDSLDAVDFAYNIARRDSDTSFFPITGAQEPLNKTYTISGTFCTPVTKNGREGTVLLATHGLGFDRSYWDPSLDASKYSFVDHAINEGYSVFYYDRLGTGQSSKVSGYTESQAETQLAILQSLTRSLRAGSCTGSLGVPTNVVHVGHSFGSFLTSALLAATPDLSDGAILTGVSYNGSQTGTLVEGFGLRVANQQAPGKWSGRDTGYLTTADIFSNAGTFFYNGSYDKNVLLYADARKQPFSAGELLTLNLLNPDAHLYTGPVMVCSPIPWAWH
ncbi:hypothetical protein PVAG01_09526 [Phlyctema vagabunda]|uniref:AB hydrolase-1 domain-containing protein n=1 Tax=Phlyctema vagabunda TaxID=108571 RepID=A0ABR4P7L3_9HELO